MGCGSSSENSNTTNNKSRSKKDDNMEGVGPQQEGNSKHPDDPASPNPLAKPSSRSGTRDKVNSSVNDALYSEEGGQPREKGEAVEFENHVDKTLNKKDGDIDGFVAFGGGEGAPECPVDENDTDEGSPGPSPGKAGKKTRRIGVSSEPIVPDAAEKFNPRVIPKDEETKKALIDVTSKNYLFGSLEPEEMDTVISAMEKEVFEPGQDILVQDEDSTEKFYFIVKGKVDILKRELPDGGYVCSFAAGQTFGELELMYLAPCAATVRCVEALECYSIDRDTYRHIVMNVSIRKRRLYKELLASVPFLSEMSDYEAMTLADALTPINFKPGEKLLSFGAESEWMYIIVKGTVKVIGRDKEDESKEVEVCEFKDGATVGELEFLNGHRAVADVVAAGDQPLKCCRLHRQHFEMCMGPVKDYLKKNADSTTYDYYHNVVKTDEEGGGGMTAFTFGSAADEQQAFTAFGGDGNTETHEEEDEEGNTNGRAQGRTRRIGVSDETQDVDDDWTPPVFEKSEDQKQMLRTTLKANPLLGSMEGRDRETLIAAMEPLSFKQGVEILTQGGDHGTHYYVITKGVAEIIKNGELIVTFSIGQGFGEMELMYIQPCVATVKARVDVDTWAIDRQTYKKLVMKLAMQRRELYAELLSKIDFLENMSEYERHTLADALSPQDVEQGLYLIKRGEQSDWMHIIVDGKVEVFGVDEESGSEARKHICFLERGACVGELEFLNQHRAVADCVAATPLRTCRLHRDHFELCMGPIVDVLRRAVRQDKYEYYQNQLDDLRGHKHLGVEGGAALTKSASNVHMLNRRQGRRQRAKAVSADVMDDSEADYTPPNYPKSEEELKTLEQLIRKSPLFSALTGDDRTVVSNALQKCNLSAGTEIVKEGDIADENYWYIIASGSVEQRVSDEEAEKGYSVIASYSQGHAFGEISIMYATPSNFSTVVTQDMEGFRLDRRSYRKIVMKLSSDRRAQYKELLSGVTFLSELTDSQQDTLADALSPVHFSPGDYLIKHGSVNNWMYIIADGVVEVFSKSQEKICDLKRGEMVGELEFLNNHKAVADCVAKTHMSACRLHRDHFELCMGPVADYIESTLKDPKYSFYNSTNKQQ